MNACRCAEQNNDDKLSTLTKNKNIALRKEAGPPSVSTTDDDCEQQVPSVALRLQQLATPAERRRSALVSCALTPKSNRRPY